MAIEITEETITIRKLTPSEGKWLNKEDVYSQEVYLGIEANPDEWTEVEEADVPESFLATAVTPEPEEPPVS